MRHGPAIVASLLCLFALAAPAGAASDRYFQTSDGVRLHYLEAAPRDKPAARTIVLVPGWTMPAWIFQRQIDDLSRHFRVIAFDPRGQGDSAIPATGYDHLRRGQDIAELLTATGGEPVVLVAWSLGVLDSLAYLRGSGDARLAGLVLVDNSVGEEPPPAPPAQPTKPGPKLPREMMMRNFVKGMFASKQPQAWLDRLTEACLRVPLAAANALLAYPVPRSYWKEAVYATAKPLLYIVRPKFEGQAGNLAARHPTAETRIVKGLGHALFVDDAAAFNAMLRDFVARRVWR